MSHTVTRWTYGPDLAQYLDCHLPESWPRPGVAVVIHGGFWRARYDAALGTPLCVDLAARGIVALNLEYRRVGCDGGWPATFDDISAGIDRLATIPGLDLSAVVTIGHSAGGHLAAWAAGRHLLPPGTPGAAPEVTVTGVVSQAGVLDLTTAAEQSVGGSAVPDLMGGPPDQFADRYRVADPRHRLPLGIPVRALHARDDDDVPFQQSTSYVTAARAAGDDAELVEVSGGHMGLIDITAPAWAATVAALDGLLR